jgi:hypothetical protein
VAHASCSGRRNRHLGTVYIVQATPRAGHEVVDFDRLNLTAWRRKLPVYMELPSDISYLEIEVPDRPIKLEMIPSDQENLKACTEMILERLNAAKSPAFLLAIKREKETVSVLGQVSAAAPRPFLIWYWRSLSLPPVVIALFALNQWLKRRAARRNKAEQPNLRY